MLALLILLLYNLIFLGVLVGLVALIAGSRQAAFAVMKRNFIGYFSNPTGYVFLCIFVFLTSLAAFWPFEFFNQNLATLDQLNYWYPLIMLVFIPAITMSIWAEEKRQGTDELLLTLPADDFDIVAGKFMAAGAIFTASLMFSQVCTFISLAWLTENDLDTGLLFTTYLGYWMVGMMMIAIGMIASFLTSNLTVSFVLGALLNAPLAFAAYGNILGNIDRGNGSFFVGVRNFCNQFIAESAIGRSFDDFGRGVLSSSSIIYFILVAIVALYVAMILIGRRHWTGGKDGNGVFWHYLVRTLALVAAVGSVVFLVRTYDVVRFDMTDQQTNTLAPATRDLIANLDQDKPVVIDAFISADLPTQFSRTRYELINLLKEFQSVADANSRQIDVNLYDNIELYSDAAEEAEERFGLEKVERMVEERGSPQRESILLAAAVRSGLDSVKIPFFESGIPVEYELVRSISTVAKKKRKRLGIVSTDARLMGGMDPTSFSMAPKHWLITELEKQYDVVEVSLERPISPDQYDALLAVQPSSLGPQQLTRFVQAVRAGCPTAIFEDPMPVTMRVPRTGEPKRSGNPMFGGGQPVPKGEMRRLWDALGVDPEITTESDLQSLRQTQQEQTPDIAWQDYMPYDSLQTFGANQAWLVVNSVGEEYDPFLSNDNPITAGLDEVLLLYASFLNVIDSDNLTHTPLITTGAKSGSIKLTDAMEVMQVPDRQAQLAYFMDKMGEASTPKTVAYAIEGKQAAAPAPAAGEDENTAAAANKPIKAVYVCDVDIMSQDFAMLRANRDMMFLKLKAQNVNFLLNTIDWLSGESEFIEVRNHEPKLVSLKRIDAKRDEAQDLARQQIRERQASTAELKRDLEEQKIAAVTEIQKRLDKMIKKGEATNAQIRQMQTELRSKQEQAERIFQVKQSKADQETSEQIQRIQNDSAKLVTDQQNAFKAAAVALPCIPPLLVGLIVFFSRRLKERDNIAKVRLK